ncbi:MAG: hypothetical protein CTY18_03295 [Methylomonas sp.]|nr:MAG: hypothetical protein CTY24_11380 [Methylobacter sp.]PPD36822.1 MAG: hypothetical protein CTY18_03295 [Methylomonas sp.]
MTSVFFSHVSSPYAIKNKTIKIKMLIRLYWRFPRKNDARRQKLSAFKTPSCQKTAGICCNFLASILLSICKDTYSSEKRQPK